VVQTGQVSNLVHKHAVIDGKVARIFNGVAPAKDGRIYYTVTSTNYPFDEALGEMLGAPSGRLVVYNPDTKENKVLQENIHFANGILLSPEEDYVIFAETFRFRLHKYFIRGPKTGSLFCIFRLVKRKAIMFLSLPKELLRYF
jgi:sugar lactone lactonase YvrE